MAAKCVFCDIVAGRVPVFVVYEDEKVLAFLDKAPLQYGHVLLVSREHIVTLGDVSADLMGPLFQAARQLSLAVESAMQAEGTFVAMNNKVSQSVPHLHIHVVPRRKGDGLKGFFWPRKKYPSDDEAAAAAAAIRDAVARE